MSDLDTFESNSWLLFGQCKFGVRIPGFVHLRMLNQECPAMCILHKLSPIGTSHIWLDSRRSKWEQPVAIQKRLSSFWTRFTRNHAKAQNIPQGCVFRRLKSKCKSCIFEWLVVGFVWIFEGQLCVLSCPFVLQQFF